MNTRLRLNKVLNRLMDAVRRLSGRNEYRLQIYKGEIKPDAIDTHAANVLGQALIKAPEQIHLVEDIKLDPKNNLIPVEPFNFEILEGIRPVLNTIQNYLKYFRTNFLDEHKSLDIL